MTQRGVPCDFGDTIALYRGIIFYKRRCIKADSTKCQPRRVGFSERVRFQSWFDMCRRGQGLCSRKQRFLWTSRRQFL